MLAGGADVSARIGSPARTVRRSAGCTDELLLRRSRSGRPGQLARVHEPVPPPAHPEEPGPGPRHLAISSGLHQQAGKVPPPAVEPARRARRIERRRRDTRNPAPLREVPARVEEHASQRPPHLARRPQQPVVVPPVEHRPVPSAHAVHRTCETRRDALHPIRERFLPVSLHDQMRVVALERVVCDAEATPLARLGQRAFPLPDQRHSPKRRDTLAHAQRDVDRTGPRHRPALAMQHGRTRPAGSPGADARTSPSHPSAELRIRRALPPNRPFERVRRRIEDHHDVTELPRAGSEE